MKSLALSFALLLTVTFLFSQTVPNTSKLTIEQIMQGPDFVGTSPSNIFWGMYGRNIYFNWNPDKENLSSLYKYSRKDGIQKVNLEEEMDLPSRFGVWTKEKKAYVYAQNGDIHLLADNLAHFQLTNTVERESNPQFKDKENLIVFQKGNDLYGLKNDIASIVQLTQFKRGNPSRDKRNPKFKEWLEEDQMDLIEVLRDRKETSDLRSERRDAREVKRPKAIYLGNKRVSNVDISDNLRFVTYRLTQSAEYIGTKVPDYVAESAYIRDLNSRPKVGSPQSTYESWIYDRERDTIYQIDTEQIPGIYDKPTYYEEYHEGEEAYSDQFEDPREVIIHGPYFSPNDQAVVVVRSQDNKDRWIMNLDLETGALDLLDRQHDEAWIGGPGIGSWNFSGGNIGWMGEANMIWYQSEETGYSHIYLQDVKTKEKRALTSGKFEIISAELNGTKSKFFVTANAEGPHEHHFYHLRVKGGEMYKVTSLEGNNEVTISPDEKMLAIRRSYSNKPWELYIQENEPGTEAIQVTESTTDAFKSYQWREPEIVYFSAEDGAKVPARIYRPAKPKKNGPAVIFVHGAGYLQNVHKWWSSYYREYMFHNILVDNGYTVLDIDYRASNGYGRDWRTGIYRHMGGKDLSDQVDGAKFLVEEYDINPKRIGIYGGSYGGFITLMAMFNEPKTFAAGAALRSVTDWAHYNHGYTANILNTPVEDPIAYRRSSPIYFAEGLQGKLVILHGMVDTNVQFQDVVRLSQRLIELGKDNWEMAVFPKEGHGFVEPSSWTDEYKRIFKLFQETLK
ncbi:MAG: prolyl oligopeptidase family serine peptidase [Bacteroidota bacterium]